MSSGVEHLTQTARLLESVFPGARTVRADYLRWLYEANPAGTVVEAHLDDEHGQIGHYAVAPVLLRRDGVVETAALSLNTAVHERARGQGLFLRLAEDVMDQAVARGIGSIVGVANANSTPGFLRHLGFSLVGALPVRVAPPLPGRSHVAIASTVPSDARLAGILSAAGGAGACGVWTPESLHWRLAAPGAHYAVQDGGDWLAVTAATRERGVPIAVVLAVFASRPLTRSECGALVRRACRDHRAAVALHAGHNDMVRLPSVPLPLRLRPSPLNLIFRDLAAPGRTPSHWSRFEFLDFDAY